MVVLINTWFSGTCICGKDSKQALLCEELDGDKPMLEVFCISVRKDPIPPMILSSVIYVASVPGAQWRTRENVTTLHLGMKEEVVEKVKEDTWVLAIILGCFCLLCLLAGGVSAAFQRKKGERADKLLKVEGSPTVMVVS